MVERLQSSDQTMAPEDSAWQAMRHFCEAGCTTYSKNPFLRESAPRRGWCAQYLYRRSDSSLGTFYRDSLRTQRFQTVITSLFEDTWAGSLKVENWLSYDLLIKPSRSSKVRAAKDHGKKFWGKLAASFSGSVHYKCIYNVSKSVMELGKLRSLWQL